MKRANIRVREAMRKHKIPTWQVADLLGVSENTVYRRFRHELPEDEQRKIIAEIERWKEGEDEN